MSKASKATKTTPGNKFYITSDRMLVAAIISNKIKPTLVSKDIKGVVHYSFKDSANLRRLLRQYDNGKIKVYTDYYNLIFDLCHKPYDWE